jgi:hypothetical protein
MKSRVSIHHIISTLKGLNENIALFYSVHDMNQIFLKYSMVYICAQMTNLRLLVIDFSYHKINCYYGNDDC